MKLSSLLKNIEYEQIINFKNVNITNLSINSKEIAKNGLFFAISGNNFNGELFVNDAVKNGAKAVISERILDVNIPQIIVKNIRLIMSKIAKVFYNNPDEKLKIIAIVGTNGKTTTATIIYNILHDSGKSVGLIGTNGIVINDLSLPNNFTTPDPIELFYSLEQMGLFGVEYVVMEVSAHAIFYNKVYGIKPKVIVYTNITNEHLDFFNSMENYSNVKLGYFYDNPQSISVVNIDDEFGKKLAQKQKNVITYGLGNPADTFAIDIVLTLGGLNFVCNCLDEIFNIKSCLTGDYNVYNLLAAISVARSLKIDNKIIIKSIEKLKKVDGRMEIFNFPNNNKIIVDYAHTPDGFEKVLSNIKHFRNGRIITLFGCVGYSDKFKRRLMGEMASKYSDFVIISSDNYSDEKFDEICLDVSININCAKIKDRAKAVDYGIKMLTNNDTLVLLGKGAENFQKTKDGNIEYNEIEFVKSYLK